MAGNDMSGEKPLVLASALTPEGVKKSLDAGTFTSILVDRSSKPGFWQAVITNLNTIGKFNLVSPDQKLGLVEPDGRSLTFEDLQSAAQVAEGYASGKTLSVERQVTPVQAFGELEMVAYLDALSQAKGIFPEET